MYAPSKNVMTTKSYIHVWHKSVNGVEFLGTRTKITFSIAIYFKF